MRMSLADDVMTLKEDPMHVYQHKQLTNGGIYYSLFVRTKNP